MPPLEALKVLIGDQIGQICLDPFGVQFKFDRWGLSVQHEIEHIEVDGTRHFYACIAADGPPLLLHRLLYKEVTAVERQELQFTLHFEGGASLSINSEIGPYECGQFYPADNVADMFVF